MSGGGSAPKYDQNAALQNQIQAASMSQYGMSSPFGSVNWTGNFADGTRQMNVNLSPFEQQKLDSAQNMLPTLNSLYGDSAAKRAEDAVYSNFENRFNEQFKQDDANLHDKLINQGIPVGSDAYNKALKAQAQNQNDARLQAANQATLTGSQTKSNELSNALSLFGNMQNINNPMSSYMPGIGTNNFQSTYDQAYNSQLANYQQDQQNKNGMWLAGGNILGGLGAAAIAASDARIKENIVPVGRLFNGLTVYRFNFKGDNVPQIGLIAQEVAEVMPEAVVEGEDGLLGVDYEMATQMPDNDNVDSRLQGNDNENGER
jgi:hypothetical protein